MRNSSIELNSMERKKRPMFFRTVAAGRARGQTCVHRKGKAGQERRRVNLLMVWVKTGCGGLDFILGPFQFGGK